MNRGQLSIAREPGSVVHAALHAPAAQIFHNIVGRLETGLGDRARLTVMALSVVAFALSYSSEGIHELVETASAFGSAGVFVATLFALFTTFGGALSAYTSILAGMLVRAVSKFDLGHETPYRVAKCPDLSTFTSSQPELMREKSVALQAATAPCGAFVACKQQLCRPMKK